MEYVLHVIILISIYSILAISLDLLIGETGLLSVMQAAYFGIGAYTSAVLSVEVGAPFILGAFAGMLLSFVVSAIVSFPLSRVFDDYFVVATFALQIVISSLFANWIELTRGPVGIPNIPPPTIFGWNIDNHLHFLMLTGGFLLAAYIVIHLLSTSPFGRVLRAIREDDLFVQSLGKDTTRFKMIALGVSAALAASAGSLYAHYIGFIDPTTFTVMDSILIISMVIVGGAASRYGPPIGASLFVALPEVFRFIGFDSATAANLRPMLFGITLVLLMRLRPRGLVGKFGLGS